MRARRGSLVGTTVDGRYRVEARIAAGGFGAIYRATHLPTGHDVALKALHADLAADRNLAARFRREAATLSRLRDPHTVMTYELGEAEDGTLYIAMELLRGVNLHQWLRTHGAMAWRAMFEIMRGVCSSLAEAHALGVIHRDLKPANIHLEPAPTPDFVKVLDFGIAKTMAGSSVDDGSELTRVGTAVGTPDYMSPEQLVGGDCDARTDIYTLGAVAYEMISGRRPFADATGPISLITAVFTRTPVPLSELAEVPPAVEALVTRCIAREAEDRFADVGELASAIDAVLAAHPAVVARTLAGYVPPVVRQPYGEEITQREVPVVCLDDSGMPARPGTEPPAAAVDDERTSREQPAIAEPVQTPPPQLADRTIVDASPPSEPRTTTQRGLGERPSRPALMTPSGPVRAATGPVRTPTGPVPTPTAPVRAATGPVPTPTAVRAATGPVPTPTGPVRAGPVPTPTAVRAATGPVQTPTAPARAAAGQPRAKTAPGRARTAPGRASTGPMQTLPGAAPTPTDRSHAPMWAVESRPVPLVWPVLAMEPSSPHGLYGTPPPGPPPSPPPRPSPPPADQPVRLVAGSQVRRPPAVDVRRRVVRSLLAVATLVMLGVMLGLVIGYGL